MAFNQFDKGPVSTPVNTDVQFDATPLIDITKAEKRPTWVSGNANCKVDQSVDGLTCRIIPNQNFVGSSDIICDVWLNNGNQERYWWQLSVGGIMSFAVTTVPKIR